MVIIGWKGNEKLFNELIKSTARKIKKIIIADPNADDVLNHISFLFNDKVEIKRYQGFEDIFNGLNVEFPL